MEREKVPKHESSLFREDKQVMFFLSFQIPWKCVWFLPQEKQKEKTWRERGEILWASNCVDRTGNQNAEIIYLYMHRWTKGRGMILQSLWAGPVQKGSESVQVALDIHPCPTGRMFETCLEPKTFKRTDLDLIILNLKIYQNYPKDFFQFS